MGWPACSSHTSGWGRAGARAAVSFFLQSLLSLLSTYCGVAFSAWPSSKAPSLHRLVGTCDWHVQGKGGAPLGRASLRRVYSSVPPTVRLVLCDGSPERPAGATWALRRLPLQWLPQVL